MDIALFVQMFETELYNIDFTKIQNTKEGIELYKKEFEKAKARAFKKFEIEYNNYAVKPDEFLNSLKEGKKHFNLLPDVSFDEDFGILNKEKLKEKKEAEKLTNEIVSENMYRRGLLKIYHPTYSDRPALVMSLGPQNITEYEEYCKILGKNNDDIDPISGKTYGEVKAKLFVEGIDRGIQIAKNIFKYQNQKDSDDFYKTYYTIIDGLNEYDDKKIKNSLDKAGLDITKYKELNQKYEDIKDIKNSLNSASNFRTNITIKTNPLYPYASMDDLALAGILHEGDLGQYLAPYSVYQKEHGKTERHNIETMYGVLNNYDFPKKLKAGVDYLSTSYRFVDMFNIYLAPALNTKLQNIQFYKGKEKIEIDLEKDNPYDEVNKMIIAGEKITLKDESGKFLANYQGNAKTFGNIIGAGNQINVNSTFDKEYNKAIASTKILAGKSKDLKENGKILKDNIKLAAKAITKKVDDALQKEIETKLGQMFKLLDKSGPEIGRENDESYFYDIKDMMKDIMNKGVDKENKTPTSFNKDKDKYISGLKSIRTFCQAYLDEKTGSDLSKEEQAKYDAISATYNDLLDVENELTNVAKMELNMEHKLELKARKDNPEYIKAMESQLKVEKENNIVNDVEKKQAFDFDITNNNQNIVYQEKAKTTSLTKEANMNKDK